MVIVIDEKKLVHNCKIVSILLVVLAVIVFLSLSSKIFHFSEANPIQYQRNFSVLNTPEKHVVSSMRKTGEVQSGVLGKNRGHGNGGSKFFDEVSRVHSSK